MRAKFLLSTLLLAVVVSSCSENSTADLIDIDNSVQLRYNTQIKNIINSNCLNCHSSPPTNGAPMQLTTYENVKDAVLNRGLIDRISRAQGSSGMMPLGGTRLPQALIDQFTTWQNEGFAE
jgi:hypothetical protein